jgi:ABC-type transporter Mla MlaB component
MPDFSNTFIFQWFSDGIPIALVRVSSECHMTLRIDKSNQGDAVTLSLCGRIREDQLTELEAFFNSASAGRSLILDLSNVKLVDLAAVRFLAQHEARGTTFQGCPAYIREWISRERSGNSAQ